MKIGSSLKGIEFDKRVSGSHNEIQSAIGAGVADVGITQIETAMTHWENGRIEILLMTGDEGSGPPWEDVPSGADAGMAGEPWARNRDFAVNSSVLDLHRAWLFELFQAGAETDGFKEARKRLPGNTLVMLDHDKALAMARNALEISSRLCAASQSIGISNRLVALKAWRRRADREPEFRSSHRVLVMIFGAFVLFNAGPG